MDALTDDDTVALERLKDQMLAFVEVCALWCFGVRKGWWSWVLGLRPEHGGNGVPGKCCYCLPACIPSGC